MFLGYGCGSDTALNLNPYENTLKCGDNTNLDRFQIESAYLNRGFIEFSFEAKEETTIKLQIIDKKNKVVRIMLDGWEVLPGRSTTIWDLQNNREDFVAPGLYRVQILIDDKVVCDGDIEVLESDIQILSEF